MEQQKSRDLSRNLNRTNDDLARLDRLLYVEKEKKGAVSDKYTVLMGEMEAAQAEKEATQSELTTQLKREKLAHQASLARQKEIEQELDDEHNARAAKEAEIVAVQMALDQEKKDMAMTLQQKNELEAKKAEVEKIEKEKEE